MEVQKHGFIFENYIKTNCFNITKYISYTSKYDIPKKYNEINNKNISIKLVKLTNTMRIECGDCLRNYDYYDDDIMYVGFYKQDKELKIVHKLYKINAKIISILMNKYIDITKIKLYIDFIKSIPYGKPDTETIRRYKNDKKQFANPYINIHPKVDSKRQRRVQISINFKKIIKDFDNYIEELIDKKINNVAIITEIKSPPRTFKNKTQMLNEKIGKNAI